MDTWIILLSYLVATSIGGIIIIGYTCTGTEDEGKIVPLACVALFFSWFILPMALLAECGAVIKRYQIKHNDSTGGKSNE